MLLLQLPVWGLWLLWQYVLQPYIFTPQEEVRQHLLDALDANFHPSVHLYAAGLRIAKLQLA